MSNRNVLTGRSETLNLAHPYPRSPLLLSRASKYGFLLLFPSFFFYHFGLGTGFLPDFARGLWGPTSALLTAVALTTVFFSGKAFAPFWTARISVVLIGYVAAWTGLNYMIGDARYVDETAIINIAMVLSWVSLVFVGAWLPWRDARLKRAAVLCYVLMLLIVLINMDPGRLVFNMRTAASQYEVASYQGFARSILVTSAFCLCALRARGSVFLVWLSSILALFIIGARSEFFGYLFASGLCMALMVARDTLRDRLLVVLGILVVAVTATLVLDASAVMNSRQLEVMDLSQARSWITRGELTKVAADQILSSPILGEFDGTLQVGRGGTGYYAHNALSAWVSFGFIGFLLYVGISGYCAFASLLKLISRGRPSPIWVLSAFINLTCFLLIVISKPVYWPLPALGWGLLLNATLSDRAMKQTYQVQT